MGTRIMLVGAHRTGKSTLAEEIVRRSGIHFIRSPLKFLLSEMRETSWGEFAEREPLKYCGFQLLGFSMMKMYMGILEDWASDRGTPDFLAYLWRIRHKFPQEIYHAVAFGLISGSPREVTVLFFRWPGFASDESGKLIDDAIFSCLYNPSCLDLGPSLETWKEIVKSWRIVEVTKENYSEVLEEVL